MHDTSFDFITYIFPRINTEDFSDPYSMIHWILSHSIHTNLCVPITIEEPFELCRSECETDSTIFCQCPYVEQFSPPGELKPQLSLLSVMTVRLTHIGMIKSTANITGCEL